MSIDLERSLAQLAESVHDEATTARMSDQVHHMVSRIRRRRAARHTATGVVGVAAAGAVAFGGVQLAGRNATQAPPAESAEPTDPVVTGFGECGSTVVDPIPDVTWSDGMTASPGPVFQGSGVEPYADVSLSWTGDVTGLEIHDPTMVVAKDGVVVGRTAEIVNVLESYPPIYNFRQQLMSCADGSVLAPGDYELYAMEPYTLNGGEPGTLQRLGGPWPLTVPDPNATEPTSEPTSEPTEPTDSQALLDQILATPAEPGTFPTCGSSINDLDDGLRPITLDMALNRTAFTAGETFSATAELRMSDGGYAIGNASPLAKLLVLKDGIVVGYQWLDSEDVTSVDLSGGAVVPFEMRASMNLCGTGEGGTGDLLPLPPGQYKAMAELDLALQELQMPGEDAVSTNELVHVVSGAVDITVE
jgi:hypothetical protein